VEQLNLLTDVVVNDGQWTIGNLNDQYSNQRSLCRFPEFSPMTAYGYDCRCEGCVAHRHSYYKHLRERGAPNCPIDGCNNPKIRGMGSKWCEEHTKIKKLCRYENCTNLKQKGSGRKYCVEHATMINGQPVCMVTCQVCERQATSIRDHRYREICTPCRQQNRKLIQNASSHKVPLVKVVSWIKQPNCDLCSRRFYLGAGGSSHTFVIDHNHSCCRGNYSCGDCVRGLLCSQCNLSLGHLEKMIGLAGLEAVMLYISPKE